MAKEELLAKLSAKIEVGRFYFPNVDRADGFGLHKPRAYQGYRNLVLDFLVFSYQLFERDDAVEHLGLAEKLQRYFTTYVFELLDPKNFLKETEKLTNRKFSKDHSIEDLLKNESSFFNELTEADVFWG